MRDESSSSERNPDKKPERPTEPKRVEPAAPHREEGMDRALKGSAQQPDSGASRDIAPILKGWDFESGTINVRKVAGEDGVPKLQMRLDLGLLQMELSGRPDGARPHNRESLLDYYEELLAAHQRTAGAQDGFQITGDQCQALREEAVMYYHRYLSLFVLGDFMGVVRDTARNLRVLDFCGLYADTEQDRLVLEEFRPYIIMMNTRAMAFIHFKEKQYRNALVLINRGLKKIRDFFNRFGQEEAFEHSSEVKVLRKFAKEIRRKLPVDPLRRLQNKLDKAVKDERYEEAAKLRDEINEMTAPKTIGP